MKINKTKYLVFENDREDPDLQIHKKMKKNNEFINIQNSLYQKNWN